jgi:hypothetical protein
MSVADDILLTSLKMGRMCPNLEFNKLITSQLYVYYAQYEATLTISGLICQLMTETLLLLLFERT